MACTSLRQAYIAAGIITDDTAPQERDGEATAGKKRTQASSNRTDSLCPGIKYRNKLLAFINSDEMDVEEYLALIWPIVEWYEQNKGVLNQDTVIHAEAEDDLEQAA